MGTATLGQIVILRPDIPGGGGVTTLMHFSPTLFLKPILCAYLGLQLTQNLFVTL